MSAVQLASVDDLRAVVADLLDVDAPLVADRQRARQLLDVSDTTFGRLVNEGVIRPVPHLRPRRYSIELIRRFAAGDSEAFAQLPRADETPGSTGAAPSSSGSVSPLRPPAKQGTGGPTRTAGGPGRPPAA